MLSLTTYMTTACCALSSNLMALPYRIYHLTTECSSFLPDISIAPLRVHYYSEALLTTALILCWSYHAKALQETVSKGLVQSPYVAPIEWIRHSGRKAHNLPLSHHEKQTKRMNICLMSAAISDIYLLST